MPGSSQDWPSRLVEHLWKQRCCNSAISTKREFRAVPKGVIFKIIRYFIMKTTLEKYRGRMNLMLTLQPGDVSCFPFGRDVPSQGPGDHPKDQEILSGTRSPAQVLQSPDGGSRSDLSHCDISGSTSSICYGRAKSAPWVWVTLFPGCLHF